MKFIFNQSRKAGATACIAAVTLLLNAASGNSLQAGEVGIYKMRPSISLLNTGSFYRDDFDSYEQKRKRIKVRNLGSYLVFDGNTGKSVVITFSGPRQITFTDFMRRPLDWGTLYNPFYFVGSEGQSPTETFFNAKGKGILIQASSGSEEGDVDNDGTDDTTIFYVSSTSGKASPKSLKAKGGNQVFLQKVPNTLNVRVGFVMHYDHAVRNNSVSYQRVRDGATFERYTSKNKARLNKKLTAAANDSTQGNLGGHAPGTFDYAVEIVKLFLDGDGYTEVSTPADFSSYIVWN